MKNMKVETTGQVRLWDVASGTQVGDLKGHGKGVTEVAFSRDGRLLASGSTDNTIRIWDLATKRELRTLTGHTSNIESIDFSPDARLLASATDDAAGVIGLRRLAELAGLMESDLAEAKTTGMIRGGRDHQIADAAKALAEGAPAAAKGEEEPPDVGRSPRPAVQRLALGRREQGSAGSRSRGTGCARTA